MKISLPVAVAIAVIAVACSPDEHEQGSDIDTKIANMEAACGKMRAEFEKKAASFSMVCGNDLMNLEDLVESAKISLREAEDAGDPSTISAAKVALRESEKHLKMMQGVFAELQTEYDQFMAEWYELMDAESELDELKAQRQVQPK